MIRIDWKEVFVTLNGIMIQMPKSVKVPLRDKYKLKALMEKHTLLLHIILKQGTSWYALDNIDYMLPPPMEKSEIWMYISDGQQIEHYSGLQTADIDITGRLCKGRHRL